ncbi:hypothetical protein [Ottowia sp. VDI28]|uniref:hypothetical protein n=1 Tax=Ottowia sp. VDI28 TaxID=3133968 RepID=UPI003C2EF7FF
MTITADERVGEADAARLVGTAQGSLKNMRTLGNGPAFFRLGVGNGSRVSYRIVDLAFWLESAREESPLEY